MDVTTSACCKRRSCTPNPGSCDITTAPPEVNIDGVYGRETRSAILRWQLTQQRPLTGILDNDDADGITYSANDVLSCYNTTYRDTKKIATIGQMRDCAGVWVTPRALLFCVLNYSCSTLPDTIEGRATVDATLRAINLTEGSRLVPKAEDLPTPNPQKLAACRISATSDEMFVACAGEPTANASYKAILSCF